MWWWEKTKSLNDKKGYMITKCKLCLCLFVVMFKKIHTLLHLFSFISHLPHRQIWFYFFNFVTYWNTIFSCCDDYLSLFIYLYLFICYSFTSHKNWKIHATLLSGTSVFYEILLLCLFMIFFNGSSKNLQINKTFENFVSNLLVLMHIPTYLLVSRASCTFITLFFESISYRTIVSFIFLFFLFKYICIENNILLSFFSCHVATTSVSSQ